MALQRETPPEYTRIGACSSVEEDPLLNEHQHAEYHHARVVRAERIQNEVTRDKGRDDIVVLLVFEPDERRGDRSRTSKRGRIARDGFYE